MAGENIEMYKMNCYDKYQYMYVSKAKITNQYPFSGKIFSGTYWGCILRYDTVVWACGYNKSFLKIRIIGLSVFPEFYLIANA